MIHRWFFWAWKKGRHDLGSRKVPSQGLRSTAEFVPEKTIFARLEVASDDILAI